MFCLEERIPQENEVRLIDLFVDSLPLEEYGFIEENRNPLGGRPAYHPSTLLKLYIYGYMNRMRSSRQLEKECYRNLEVMWLMGKLAPDHNTISNFRRDNPDAIKKCLDRTWRRSEKQKAQEKINQHLKHQEKYQELEKQLEASGEVQISTSDPESRQLVVRNMTTEVAYNLQSTADAKHNIPINYEITNENDSKAMGGMLEQAVETLGHNEFTAVFDKGYHTGTEFETADKLGVEVLVAVPDLPSSSMAPDPAYNISEFVYNQQEDTYTCPAGNTLKTNGRWYGKSRNHPGRKKQEPIKMKQYKTDACKTCPVYDLCIRAKNKRGRVIERLVYAHLLEKNKQRMKEHYEIYRQRQAIVEHPFGTIKRQCLC